MSGKGIIDSLLPASDAIFGIRDSIGAVIKPVFLVTRSWYTDEDLTVASSQVGEGFGDDKEVPLLPSPRLKNFAQDIRLKEGGSIKAGDIILSNVSKNSYDESDLDASVSDANVEKLYRVGDKIYQVINIYEKYVSWNVQLRELTNQARYING